MSMFGNLSASRTMIDANVLIFAASDIVEEDSVAHRQSITAAKQFFQSQQVIRISSVALAEVVRKISPEERESLLGMGHPLDDLYADPLTGDMAKLAGDLVNYRCPPGLFCRKCKNAIREAAQPPCKVCNQLIPPYHRLDDSFVVATAVLTKGIDRLLTADTGVVEYRNALKNEELLKRWPQLARLTIDFLRLDNGPLYSAGERDEAEKPDANSATVQKSSSGTKPK